MSPLPIPLPAGGPAPGGLPVPLADDHGLPSSQQRFADGAPVRIEIPSVEGPEALETVVETARRLDVPVRRVSQGSGIMLLTDEEIRQMASTGDEAGIEVCLFVGPRAAWDVGRQAASPSGAAMAGALRGADQLRFAIDDVARACALGIRSVLVADLGLLWALAQLRAAGELPADLILKVSVSMPVANPASAHVVEQLGATTINLPVDLTSPQLAAIRAATRLPLDLYIEGPDDFGAPVRYHELPEIVRVTAPLYAKFAVRNAASIYPAGGHLRSLVVESARERVRRASLGVAALRRAGVEL